MSKRSKKRKVWYPDSLFYKMLIEENSEGDLESVVTEYNWNYNEDFKPEDAITSYRKWKRTQRYAN
jgi:hypothetical protein